MQKTKLGISVNLLGAIVCLAPLTGGYIFLLGLVLYILLMEENEWLKKTAIQVLGVTFIFGFASIALDIIPSVLNVLSNLMSIFGSNFSISFINRIFNAADSLVSFARLLVLFLMTYKSLSQGSLHIQKIDEFMDKHTK